jgi:hypothetical protein
MIDGNPSRKERTRGGVVEGTKKIERTRVHNLPKPKSGM